MMRKKTQVVTASTGTPSPAEIKYALHRAGFTSPVPIAGPQLATGL